MLDWIARYWIGAAFGVLTGVLSWTVRRIRNRQKEQSERQQAIEAGVQALLHDRIYGEYAKCLKKGFADVDDMKNLEFLYRPYHALGGNGTGTELFERVKKMPVSPAERGTECGRQQ